MSDLGNKEIFSKNLQYYMMINNKDRNDISKDLVIPYSTVTDWVNGNVYPRIDKIELLANYFGIWKSDLVEARTNNIIKSKSIRIPVLGKIPAGIPIEMVEDIIEGEFEDISEDMLKGDKQYFALKIDEDNGHSMEPDYKPGDILIVLKQECCENGDDCIVAINGDDATFKKVYKYESGITLQPINTNQYQPTFFSNQEIIDKPVKVLGIVVEFRRKTKRRENI